ncbi:MAG: glutamine--fructose-6-phosphate transaminase (isomerizing) [Candidatus Kerfeldbacteria bacterium]|nr:glutamine--fructose-6-phosphate transaminase (isomerizing) [Candidatus Kerfeldbacteria bacterium]
MCGIVGYIGTRPSLPVLLGGLRRVEYRGYDSAGVAVIAGGSIAVRKRHGKIAELEKLLHERPLPEAIVGIGHTRWATHGIPSDANAHPHLSQDGTVAVVHNGTIENFAELRTMLSNEGYTFVSQTDTEVLAHLIERFLRKGSTLVDAVQKVHAIVQGAYGIAVMTSREPQRVVGARNGSPLVLGVADHGYILGSDAVSVREHTNKVVYFNDGEMVVLEPQGYRTLTIANEEITKQVEELSWTLDEIAMGGFPHFMLKEIHEQPQAIERTLAGRVVTSDTTVHLGGMQKIEAFARDGMKDILIAACGTSWHAGLVAKRIFEKFLHLPVRVEYASEFANGSTPLDAGTLMIVISQSGETKDTIAAAQKAKAAGSTVWNVCNVVGSSLTRIADSGVYLHAGPEIGVASTKAFTCQIIALILTGLKLAELRQTTRLDTRGRSIILEGLLALPGQIRHILSDSDHVLDIARQYAAHRNFLYLGRGYNFPTALEGALKLKEISYIHAEGYPAGEMKHGPIALIDPEMPVVVIAPRHGEDEATYYKVLSNAEEVAARRGKVIMIASEDDSRPEELRGEGKVERILRIPRTIPMLSPILASVYLQLLAYHIASVRGCPIDKPRNLAKSVTVE